MSASRAATGETSDPRQLVRKTFRTVRAYAELGLDLPAFQAASLGIGRPFTVIGFLKFAMWFGHRCPFCMLNSPRRQGGQSNILDYQLLAPLRRWFCGSRIGARWTVGGSRKKTGSGGVEVQDLGLAVQLNLE